MSHPFEELGIRTDLIQGIRELNIQTPTKIQEAAIPFLVKNGGELIAQAQTGTGKTAAFGLPLLMTVDPDSEFVQALVVAPTRELAKQIGKQLFRYTKYAESKIFIEVLCGGDKIDLQISRLKRPTQIIVVTPGRLMDLLERKAVKLDRVKHLVLDEADEMLSLGFQKELREIFKLTESRRSTWLFSATFPDRVNYLIKDCMQPDAEFIKVDQSHVVNRDIVHKYAVVDRSEKTDFISDFLTGRGDRRGLIFCRTKAGANSLCNQLIDRKFSIDVLQGDLTQQERDKVMRAFKKQRVQFLIATDVAARGIDVEGLSFVVHHQPPDQLEYYTHRSGRTARAGKKGISLVLIEPRERKRIETIEEELGVTFSEWRNR